MSAPYHIRLEQQAPDDDGCLLASVAFPGGEDGNDAANTVATGLTPLDGDRRRENWYAQKPVQHEQNETLHYAFNDEVLFGHARLAAGKGLEPETLATYRMLQDTLKKHRMSLTRIWHYLPELCGGGALSFYRQFCRGRAEALGTLQSRYCAATVIGTRAAGGVFYFVASKEAGLGIENPRQVSAYHYPPRYSNPPPAFTRATLKQWPQTRQLHISGTAGIVGHESMHPGDVAGQFAEIVRNLEALLAQAARDEPALGEARVNDLAGCKIYLSPRADKRELLDAVRAHLGGHFEFRLFSGEMCRPELLVEVEGLVERRRDA